MAVFRILSTRIVTNAPQQYIPRAIQIRVSPPDKAPETPVFRELFSCPKTGFCLIFSLIGSTGGNCTDKMLHAVSTFALHLVSHMAVCVQCEGGSGVAQISLHRLDIVAGADRGDCVGVTQVVETGIGTTRRFKSGCHLQKKTTLSGGFLLLPPRTAMRVL